jgi:2-polyprenyl-3-methyl-5-hydroxy-6-metoxy-1,4-benzoquinol methylase
MKRVYPDTNWPENWRLSHTYDLCEVYGEGGPNNGYVNAYKARRDVALDLLKHALPPGSSVLDVAAAQGNFTLKMAEMGYRVTWNDLRADLEQYVRLKHESGEVVYSPGNVFDLDFPSEFDGVLITEIIEHVAHPDDFLRKITALVRPGGYVVMTTPNGAYVRNTLPRFSEFEDPSVFESCQFKPNSDGHIFLLHPDEIRQLGEDAGLLMREFLLYTTPLTAGHMKLRHLLRTIPDNLVWTLERLMRGLPFRITRKLMLQSAALYQKPA